MRKFWNFTDEGGVRTLRIEGQIADETWFGDEVTPQQFKNDLISGTGDITLWINSPGVMFLRPLKSITCLWIIREMSMSSLMV